MKKIVQPRTLAPLSLIIDELCAYAKRGIVCAACDHLESIRKFAVDALETLASTVFG